MIGWKKMRFNKGKFNTLMSLLRSQLKNQKFIIFEKIPLCELEHLQLNLKIILEIASI